MIWYQCAACKEMVYQDVYWIDDGTMIFCPICGGTTVVNLTVYSNQKKESTEDQTIKESPTAE